MNKIWRGEMIFTCGTRACNECGALADTLFGIADAPTRHACRACVLDRSRGIAVIDRRGDTLSGTRIARELDAQTAIMLHLETKARAKHPGIDYGPPLDLLPLPAAYLHVLSALDRCCRVDADFSTALSELREQYQLTTFFSPKQTLLVQWRLSENGIAHDPGRFVVSIRSEREVAQMRGLGDWRKRKLALYLSWAQRSRWGF